MVHRHPPEPFPIQRHGGFLLPVIITVCVIAVIGTAAVFLLGLWDGGLRRSGINPNVFADGMGIYLLDEGKYHLLVWRKKIVSAPGAVPDPKDIAEAARDAIQVGPNARFFVYGTDLTHWATVPPYLMAFCIIRDERTIDGIYPVRVKPIDPVHGPIYELLLPTIIEPLKAGNLNSLFWVLNFQYSCNDGWSFRFARK